MDCVKLLHFFFATLFLLVFSVSGQQEELLVDLSGDRWPNGVIPVQLHPSVAPIVGLLHAAMLHIEAQTCVRFEWRTTESDYVHILARPHGCYSRVGNTGGRQLLSLSPGCFNLGSILHELCHTIGLQHEHMRWDRDEYLDILWPNIRQDMIGQFRKLPLERYAPVMPFAYDSIMIYSSWAFSSTPGAITMLPKVSGQRLVASHRKSALSQSDVANINAFYQC